MNPTPVKLRQMGRAVAAAAMKACHGQKSTVVVPLAHLLDVCSGHDVDALTPMDFEALAGAMRDALDEAEHGA
jgi:hypothetical protein